MLKKLEPDGRGNLPEETPYDKQIRFIREEFIARYIHEGLKPTEVVEKARHSLAVATVSNFLKRKTRRPTTHTLFAIADALGLEIIFQNRESHTLFGAPVKPRMSQIKRVEQRATKMLVS